MKLPLIALAALMFPAVTHAADCSCNAKSAKMVNTPAPEGCGDRLSYNYFETGFIQSRFNGSDTANGGYAEFAHDLNKNFFLDGSFTFLEDGTDSQEYAIGVGAHLPLTKKIDLVGRVGYSYLDAGAGFNQVYTSVGFRAQVTCLIELYGKLYYTHNRDSDDISGGGGIIWHLTDHVGLNTGAAWGREGWTWQAGVRYQW